MTTLITTDSPTYIRRLARAITAAIATAGGAYLNGQRVLRVRYTGRLVATMLTPGGGTCDVTHESAWTDGYGRVICASRQVRP